MHEKKLRPPHSTTPAAMKIYKSLIIRSSGSSDYPTRRK